MFNEFKTFQSLALESTNTKAVKDEASNEYKTLTNEIAYCAFYILASGSEEDKASLINSIAKDAPLNSHKGQVSKARKVLEVFEQIEVLEYMAGEGVTLEALKAVPHDALPDVPLSTLYKAASAILNTESEVQKRERAILKQAKDDASRAIGIALTKKQFDSLPNKLDYVASATSAYDVANALKGLESREEAITRLASEIMALNALDEVMALINQPSVKVA